MSRVSQETIEKLNAFIDSLPAEARKKCALCNETLTHIVKQAEAQTGAPMKTVCRAIADEINEGAAPADVVNPLQLRQRVIRNEGCNDKCTNRTDNNSDQTYQKEVKQAEKPDAAQEYMQAVETVSEEFEAAFRQMIGAIQNAREEGWVSTTKTAALKRINSLALIIS